MSEEGLTEREGSVFMSDWARETVSKLRAQADFQTQEAAAQLQRKKLRQQQGPILWNEVREHVKTKCARLSHEYGAEILTFMGGENAQLDVRFKSPSGKTHELKATFDASFADKALRWKTSGHRMNEPQTGTCELTVKNDIVIFLTGAHSYTTESIAEKMLDDLLLA